MENEETPFNICLVIDGIRQEETSHDYVALLDKEVMDHYLWGEFKQRRLPDAMSSSVYLEIQENGVHHSRITF